MKSFPKRRFVKERRERSWLEIYSISLENYNFCTTSPQPSVWSEKCCILLTSRFTQDGTFLSIPTGRSRRYLGSEWAIFSCLAGGVACGFISRALLQLQRGSSSLTSTCAPTTASTSHWKWVLLSIFEDIFLCARQTNFVVIEICCKFFFFLYFFFLSSEKKELSVKKDTRTNPRRNGETGDFSVKEPLLLFLSERLMGCI